ncbi:MAG: TonB C-terminal domain-containing protein [Betaproteobacteria bacterium]|nr:MAG: TonB C-terminal domain-containing protein [Betaproteobacteria bacterium]
MNTLQLDAGRFIADMPEPRPITAAVLTVAVHAGFATILVLTMSWQERIEPFAHVKLWQSMPTTTKTRKTGQPRPEPPPPKVVPSDPPQPVPVQVQTEPAAPPAQPDIAAPPAQPDFAAPPATTLPPQQADLAAPERETIERTAPDPVDAASIEPPPVALETTTLEMMDRTAPTAINNASVEPPPVDLSVPKRNMADKPIPDPTSSVAVEPPPRVVETPLEEHSAPQPELDVETMKRERALALAQLLREEETIRLDNRLKQEREARTAEQKQRLEEREQKLAQELSEIRTATEQRRDERRAVEEKGAATRAMTEDYRARISARIRQRVILPPDLQGNPEAIYTVALLPGGTVTEIRLVKTSGVATYDAAIERAIFAAQPLPVPEDPRFFQANFKNLRLNFRPKE